MWLQLKIITVMTITLCVTILSNKEILVME
jgi:hypothetical protein